jgi:hypothetical protein
MQNEPNFVSLRPRHWRAGDAGLLPEIGWPASRVFQTFLDNLRPICTAIDTQLKALPTLLSSLEAFCRFELRVSRHFSTFYGPSVQSMDTQLGARQRRPRRFTEVVLNE